MKNIFTRDSSEAGVGTAQRLAFVHHKGGTGKTTSCINIAGWLVRMKQKVLLVDLDPQGNATAGLGIDRNTLEGSMDDVLLGRKGIGEVILETASGVYLAPSSLDLLTLEASLAGRANRTHLLKEQLHPIERQFHYILVDLPPGSTFLMINGLVACEDIAIPLDSGVFAYETLETLKTLILDLAGGLGVELNVRLVLLRSFSADLLDWGLTREIRNLVAKFLADHGLPRVKILTIPFSRQIYRAQMKGKPISHFAPLSDVGRAYKWIAKDLVNGKV